MSGLVYSAHQPDLFPYSGFWYKLAKSDIFELKIFDQFQQKPGYQRRVKMRDQWVGLTAKSNSSYDPINRYRINPQIGPVALVTGITVAYRDAPNWGKYGDIVCDKIMQTQTPLLWQFNTEMLILIRDLLGIATPFSIGVPHEGKGSAGIVETIQAYKGVTTYLSGEGGRAYMGDCKEFTDAGIDVVFSRHQHTTGDSILTVLMEYDDPMEIILKEKQENDV